MFLTRTAAECGRKGLRLGDDLIAALLLYDWPGNIRQLANEIRRVGAMAADGQTLVAADLTPEVTANWNARPTVPSRSAAPAVEVRLDQPLAQAVAELERKFVEHALSASSGRVADAAQSAGLVAKRIVPETTALGTGRVTTKEAGLFRSLARGKSPASFVRYFAAWSCFATFSTSAHTRSRLPLQILPICSSV